MEHGLHPSTLLDPFPLLLLHPAHVSGLVWRRGKGSAYENVELSGCFREGAESLVIYVAKSKH